MYKPFVRACNYALEALSAINDVDGLPQFSEEKQIVFVHNHNRSIYSGSHLRESQVKPDIVVLQWNLFKRDQELPDCTPYSQSYEDDICVSGSGLDLTWRAVRSTVEMMATGVPKKQGLMMNFDTGFEALEELPPYTSLDDAPQPDFCQEQLPANECGCGSFAEFL